MNKNDLVKEIAKQTAVTYKEANSTLDIISNLIKDALKNGEEVKIVGFGKFGIKERATRVTYNPKTKKKMVIPAGKVPCFKVGKELKRAVSE